MIKLTTLDDCPDGACQFEIDSSCNFVGVIHYCKFHQAMSDSGIKDAQIWDEMRKKATSREQARYAAKLSLGLDKEHPGICFKIEKDCTFTLGINQKGEKMPEWPDIKGKLITDIEAAIIDCPSKGCVKYG